MNLYPWGLCPVHREGPSPHWQGTVHRGYNMAVKKSTDSKAAGKGKQVEEVQAKVSEPTILDKNPVRTLMFKDLMLQEIVDGLKAEQVPKEEMEEVLFLTVTNAVLERVGLNLPQELLYIFQENLDDYLAISMIDREHQVELLSLFRDQFLAAQGDSFDDERALMEALTAFEDQWWDSPKDFLGDRSPNELMDEAKEKMESVLHKDEECGCGCEECEDDEYWSARSYIIRDMWFTTMSESLSKESMPTPQKRERLFMSLTNALLDMVVNVMPDFMSEDLFQGLDHNLELSLVSKENKADVMALFEAALVQFEEQWWGSDLKELGGKSPDQAMQAMARKYGL